MFWTFHGETGQELTKCTFKKSRKHVWCRVCPSFYCGPKEPLLKQNIHCVPCIPPCDITGLYVLHILSRAKAGFLLTSGVMATRYWIALDDSGREIHFSDSQWNGFGQEQWFSISNSPWGALSFCSSLSLHLVDSIVLLSEQWNGLSSSSALSGVFVLWNKWTDGSQTSDGSWRLEVCISLCVCLLVRIGTLRTCVCTLLCVPMHVVYVCVCVCVCIWASPVGILALWYLAKLWVLDFGGLAEWREAMMSRRREREKKKGRWRKKKQLWELKKGGKLRNNWKK